jgi:hypothetical protein
VSEPTYEVVLHAGPLPPLSDDPLTKLELAFREVCAGVLVGDRVDVNPRLKRMAAENRTAWHARTGTPVRRDGEWR